jgi:hypothetical protein
MTTTSERGNDPVTTAPEPQAIPGEAQRIPQHKPDGPLAGMLLAAGIGTFFLGLFTTLAEVSADFKDFLTLNDSVGPLSGKTIFAAALFIVSAVVLVPLLARRDGLLRRATIAFVVLTVLGYLGTFPTFFQAFA